MKSILGLSSKYISFVVLGSNYFSLIIYKFLSFPNSKNLLVLVRTKVPLPLGIEQELRTYSPDLRGNYYDF
jgi:hypothetical protein